MTRKVGISIGTVFSFSTSARLLRPGRRCFRRPRRYRWALPRKGSRQAPSIDLLEEVSLERAAAFADKGKLA